MTLSLLHNGQELANLRKRGRLRCLDDQTTVHSHGDVCLGLVHNTDWDLFLRKLLFWNGEIRNQR